MEEEWRVFLRENAPELYEHMRRSLRHISECNERNEEKLRAEKEELQVRLEIERGANDAKLKSELADARVDVGRLQTRVQHLFDGLCEMQAQRDALQARIDGAVKGWGLFDKEGWANAYRNESVAHCFANIGKNVTVYPVRILRESEE